MNRTMKKTLLAFATCIVLAGNAIAGPGDSTPHPYVGVGASVVDRTGGSAKVNTKIVGGVALSDSLGVEAGVVDFRRGVLVGTPAPEARTIDLGGFGAYVAARFSRPIMETLSVFGKLGVAQSERKIGSNGSVRKESDTGLYAGFGLQYAVTKKVALTAEYERYGKDKKAGAKSDAWTLGLKYEF